MTTYRLKKNLMDRLTDGSMIMLLAAALAVLAMSGHGQAASNDAQADPTAAAASVQTVAADVSTHLPR